ncbi:hypothetical protein CEXT_659931 [Caerostris extrusa]|uniref:Uncharacterized protein n=1 Tax=Caerostris extrusa TaxID=172846 RepID=A0AAV4XW14_CAEEX|nr:hypothetical protein CEXT_659931 [Caerostris extrusa]
MYSSLCPFHQPNLVLPVSVVSCLHKPMQSTICIMARYFLSPPSTCVGMEIHRAMLLFLVVDDPVTVVLWLIQEVEHYGMRVWAFVVK